MFLLDYLDEYIEPKSVRCDTNNYLLCTLPFREMQQHGFAKTVYRGLCVLPKTESPLRRTDSLTGRVNFRVSESVLKHIVRTFFQRGFRDALDEARNELTLEEQPLIYRLAYVVDQLLYSYKYLMVKLCLSSPVIKPEVITSYVETRNWLNSIIRCLAWHPKCSKIAVTCFDDIVRIFTVPTCKILRLHTISQKQITCMAWRPVCGNEIAIGCNKGMIIWIIEKQRPLIHRFISHPNGLPIVSMQWNKNGTILATASIVDPVILLWEADRLKWMPLKCYGPPISMIKWAADSDWLFSGTTKSTFCIWDCENLWKPKRWNLISGSVQSACWSPCGTYLVFVTTTEQFLYRLQLQLNKPLADLRQKTVGRTIVGGMPQQLAWDCDGRFLCITFKESDCIVIYYTYLLSDGLQISPAFYIEEKNCRAFPNFICFQSKHCRNNKIVLTIAWSSGYIQHCQLE